MQRCKGQRCKGAKLTAKKIRGLTDKQTNKVTSSLLELLVAAKNYWSRNSGLTNKGVKNRGSKNIGPENFCPKVLVKNIK